MFKFNNKNTRTKSVAFYSVSIVDFELVNVTWEVNSTLNDDRDPEQLLKEQFMVMTMK